MQRHTSLQTLGIKPWQVKHACWPHGVQPIVASSVRHKMSRMNYKDPSVRLQRVSDPLLPSESLPKQLADKQRQEECAFADLTLVNH